MMSVKRIIYFIFLSFIALHAQNLQEEIDSLEKHFKNFEYKQVLEKGNFLLADAFTNKEDSLQIYQYMLSSAYALNDTARAKTIINDILECDPSHQLNPRQVSPKIIELFNYIKKRHQSAKQTDSLHVAGFDPTELNRFLIKPHVAVTSVFLPGSGHLLSGYKNKGYILSSVSALLLGGAVYTTIQTNHYRDDYMAARGDANYDRLYNRYNSYYKIRNALFAGYLLWGLYSIYDLHLQQQRSIALSANAESVSIAFQFHW